MKLKRVGHYELTSKDPRDIEPGDTIAETVLTSAGTEWRYYTVAVVRDGQDGIHDMTDDNGNRHHISSYVPKYIVVS